MVLLCFSCFYVINHVAFTPANIQNIFLSAKLLLSNKMKEPTKKGQRDEEGSTAETSPKERRKIVEGWV